MEVCPVDCFYEGPNFLVINPDECIDCALCEPECPVDAIFRKTNYQKINKNISNLTPAEREVGEHHRKKRSDARHEEWAEIKDKREHLEED